MPSILIVCGGTGGHLSPGIALAEQLMLRKHDCTLVISRKKVDARLIEKYSGLDFAEAPGAPFHFQPMALIRFVCHQLAAFFYAFKLLLVKKPDLVVGFGGFVTAGFAIPAWLMGIPFVLHEANRVVGRANRLLGGFATRIFLPPGLILPGGRFQRIRHAALPLRQEFQPMDKLAARKRLGIESEGKLLVIVGGSQGAQPLNRWARENAAALAEKGIALYCLTGMRQNRHQPMKREIGQAGTAASHFVEFSDDMPSVLSSADVVVSRAGAGSIAEIIRCQAPSILIPYPMARDNHQWANAEYIEKFGAAQVLDQADLSQLHEMVEALIFNENRLIEMGEALRRLDRSQGVYSLVNSLEKLVDWAHVPGASEISSSEQI